MKFKNIINVLTKQVKNIDSLWMEKENLMKIIWRKMFFTKFVSKYEEQRQILLAVIKYLQDENRDYYQIQE